MNEKLVVAIWCIFMMIIYFARHFDLLFPLDLWALIFEGGGIVHEIVFRVMTSPKEMEF